MRKFFWQRWALVFMLVSRLVIGELGHAMPVGDAEELGGAAHHHPMPGLDTAACPEHDARSHEPAAQTSDALTAGTSCHESVEPASSGQDCCESGDCECPCVHVPCSALDALVLSSIATTSLRTPRSADGLISQRPSGLFRPPA